MAIDSQKIDAIVQALYELFQEDYKDKVKIAEILNSSQKKKLEKAYFDAKDKLNAAISNKQYTAYDKHKKLQVAHSKESTISSILRLTTSIGGYSKPTVNPQLSSERKQHEEERKKQNHRLEEIKLLNRKAKQNQTLEINWDAFPLFLRFLLIFDESKIEDGYFDCYPIIEAGKKVEFPALVKNSVFYDEKENFSFTLTLKVARGNFFNLIKLLKEKLNWFFLALDEASVAECRETSSFVMQCLYNTIKTVYVDYFFTKFPDNVNGEVCHREASRYIGSYLTRLLKEKYFENDLSSSMAGLQEKISQVTYSNYQLSSIDMYRYLMRDSFLKKHQAFQELEINIISDLTENILCSKLSIINANELEKLSYNQLSFTTLMLVNFGDEKKPKWGCIHQKEGKWCAYLPEGHDIKEIIVGNIPNLNESEALRQTSKPLKIEIKTFAVNLTSSISGDVWQKSQYSLLANVIPSLLSGDLTIAQNRNQIDDEVMQAYVFEQIAGSKNKKKLLHRALVLSQPYSDKTATEICSLSEQDFSKRFSSPFALLPDVINYEELLKAYDDGIINREPEKDKLSLNIRNIDDILLGLYGNQLAQITIKKNKKLKFTNSENFLPLIKLIFDYDTYILSFNCDDTINARLKIHADSCAARNRLLTAVHAKNIATHYNTIAERKLLWNEAAETMIDFFQHPERNAEFIESYVSHKENWTINCNPEYHEKIRNSAIWQFMQFAQMGTEGLEYFFKKLDFSAIRQANLNACFDLQGNRFDRFESSFTQKLYCELHHYLTNHSEKHLKQPLFSQLALILPKDISLDSASIIAILRLLDEKDNFSLQQSLVLHDFDLNNTFHNDLFRKLKKCIEDEKIKTQIVIPNLDRADFSHKEAASYKGHYKKLQNSVLTNRHSVRQPELKENTQSLEKLQVTECLISNDQTLKGDKRWPLIMTNDTAVQHQQQQQQQQQENEEEQKIHTAPYDRDESELITRENITTKYQRKWNKLSVENQHLLGSKADLKTLFNRLVGSEQNAPHIIAKVEPEAMEKILAYAPKFRLGLLLNNLPAGFSLAQSKKNNQLILCYSTEQEKLDLIKFQSLAKRVNPFKIKLETKMPAILDWQGDYRLLDELVEKQKLPALTLWHDLAEENFSLRAELLDVFKTISINEKPYLFNQDPITPENSHKNASAHMQSYCVDQHLVGKNTQVKIRRLLKIWVESWKNSEQQTLLSQTFIDFIFSEDQPYCLTNDNLMSLGQLFYHYGVSANTGPKAEKGVFYFFKLAEAIHTAFEKTFFENWKSCFVDPVVNLSELLEKEQVDAVVDCINSFKEPRFKKEVYLNVWWKLVKKNTEATGYSRLAPQWSAFKAFINYLEENQLVLSESVFDACLKNNPDFQMQVFLERLMIVLKKLAQYDEGHANQQTLLNHLAEIDVSHSGIFYSVIFENFKLFDKRLQLNKFSDTGPISHLPFCDASLSNKEWWLNALRFAARLSSSEKTFNDYNAFFQVIDDKTIEECDKANLARLLLNCTSKGIDNLAQLSINSELLNSLNDTKLNADGFFDFLSRLNDLFDLDIKTESNQLQLRFDDSLNLYKALSDPSLADQQLLEALDATFVNVSGRLLQFFASRLKEVTPDSAPDKRSSYFGSGALLSLYNMATNWWNNITEYNNELIKNLVSFYTFINKINIDFNSPLFSTLGWLCYPYTTTEEANELIDLYNHVKHRAQLDFLFKQLNSIDLSASKCLPSAKELIDVVTSMNSVSLEAAAVVARQTFISKQLQMGTIIPLQDAAYRPLNNTEVLTFINKLSGKKGLLSCFHHENKQLLRKLLAQSIALPCKGDTQALLTQFEVLLLKLDKKEYFNELGQLIALLQSAAPSKKYYALAPLIKILENLLQESNEEKLYPFNVLEAILNKENQRLDSTLVNNNLALLTDESDANLLHAIQGFIGLDFSPQQKKQLIHLALHANSDNYVYFNACLAFINGSKKSTNAYAIYLEVILQIANEADNKPAKLEDGKAFISLFKELIDFAPKDSFWLETLCHLAKLSLQLKPTTFFWDRFSEIRNKSSDKIFKLQTIILSYAISNQKDNQAWFKNAEDLLLLLQDLPVKQLEILAEYYQHTPKPSAEFLFHCASFFEDKLNAVTSITQMLHYFEAHYEKNSKRRYSTSDKDQENLARILSELKLKGGKPLCAQQQQHLLNLFSFLNNESQFQKLNNLNRNDLEQHLDRLAEQVRTDPTNVYVKVRMLAAMREILLRSTGKWANHTQMLTLIYAAVHDGNLLYQVGTGQGKSIISFMRAAFLALNGKTVDVLSAKESLSERDHAEFAPVFVAMGISSAYIDQNSLAQNYRIKSGNSGVGAVNYATIGGLSLFRSRCAWEQTKTGAAKQDSVALLDESDHILYDEDTQFNFTASNSDVFNYNSWVYVIANKFYEANKEKFKGTITTNDLNQLIKAILNEAYSSPKKSNFIAQYNLYHPQANSAEVENALLELLNAAHSAAQLEKNKHYCVVNELKWVSGELIPTRVAKVLIKNQPKEGSSYSNLVQQLLHTRLNQEALLNGEAANFFIDAKTQVALSQNAPHVLNEKYSHIEGFTGTAGNRAERAYLKANYGLDAIIKLPCHETSNSQQLATVFAEDNVAQIEAIVSAILDSSRQPILITCRDDDAVLALYEKIKNRLQSVGFDLNKLIADSNTSNKSETELLQRAAKTGVVILSSRMGRGTDIKPNSDEGLKVIRTYLAERRTVKQEYGRQGRNGKKGSYVDILNWSEISKTYDQLRIQYPTEVKQCDAYQKKKLAKRLEKLSKEDKNFSWLLEKDMQQKLLKAETVAVIQNGLSQQRNYIRRAKELLVAKLSTAYELALAAGRDNSKVWLAFRKNMDACWDNRLEGNKAETVAVFKEFINNISGLWPQQLGRFPSIENLLQQDPWSLLNKIWNSPENSQATSQNAEATVTLLTHWQQWSKKNKFYIATIQQAFIGNAEEKLLETFHRLIGEITNKKHLADYQVDLYRIFYATSSLLIPMRNSIPLLQSVVETENPVNLKQKIEILTHFFGHSLFKGKDQSIAEFEKFALISTMFSRLLGYIEKNDSKVLTNLLNTLLDALANHWPLDKEKLEHIDHCLLANEAVCQLALLTDLDKQSNKPFINKLISIVKQDRHVTSLKARLASFVDVIVKYQEKIAEKPEFLPLVMSIFLEAVSDEDGIKSKLREILFNLPSIVSSEQMMQAFEQCENEQGEKDLTKMKDHLSGLYDAAREFEKYFEKRKENASDQLIKYFRENPVDKSYAFFAALNVQACYALDEEVLTVLAEKYYKKGLKESLENIFCKAKKFEGWLSYIEEKTLLLLDSTWSSEAANAISAITERLTSDDFSIFFKSIDTGKLERITLHWLAHHGVLHGDNVLKQCHQGYSDLFKQTLMLDKKAPRTDKLQAFIKAGNLLGELKLGLADKPLFLSSPRLAEAEERQQELKNTCQALLTPYGGFFSTANSIRNKQVKDLKKAIHNLSSTEQDFYKKLLNLINETQLDILNKDKGKRCNKKGYSRLFDITLELKKMLLAQLPNDEQSRACIPYAYEANKTIYNEITQVLADRQQESSFFTKFFERFGFKSDKHLSYLRELSVTYAAANLIKEQEDATLPFNQV